MIYAKPSDMAERYGERELIALTDRDGTGEMGVAVLVRALADAQAFIDGYVGKVYQLPLLGCVQPATQSGALPVYVAPPVLTRIACDLARYYLYTDLPDEHEVTRRHKAVVAELKAIGELATQLVCPWGGSPGLAVHADPLAEADVYHSFTPRQITNSSLRGFA
jgi:phage gp36-like protein